MPHFFERRDPLGNSPAIGVVALLLFLTPLAWWSLKQTRLENDVATCLSPQDPQRRVLAWAHEQFPIHEPIYVSWTGSSLGDPRMDRLIERIEPKPDANGIRRGGLPHVADVVSPRETLARLRTNGVETHESIRRLQGVILGAGPLRVRLTEAARPRAKRWLSDLPALASRDLGLKLVVNGPENDLNVLAMPPGFTADNGDEHPAEPPAILSADGTLLAEGTVAHDLSLTWDGMRVGTPQTAEIVAWLSKLQPTDPRSGTDPVIESCFFVPGAPIALAVALSEAGEADKVEALHKIRAAAIDAGIPATDLKFGGQAVAHLELNREVLHAAWNPAFPWTQLPQRSVLLASVLAGAVLTLVMVRSIRLATIVLSGALLTTFFTLAIVPATGGTLNLVLIVLPPLLLATTLAGGIHVANYWRHAAADDLRTAAVESCRRAARPGFLAAGTTAIGLGSLALSGLKPVHDFGVYAMIGMMLSFLMVVYGLPALLLLWPGQAAQDVGSDHPLWRGVGRWFTRRPLLQFAGGLSVCLAGSVGLAWFQMESSVLRFFPESSSIVQEDRFLENQIAGLVPMEMIVRFDEQAQQQANFFDRLEMVREIEERIRRHPEISGCLALADFQPYTEPLPENASLLASSRYHKRANTAEDRVRTGEVADGQTNYAVAKRAGDLSPGDKALCREGEELWRITAQTALLTSADHRTIVDELNQIAQEVLRFQPGASHVVTGTAPLLLRTQQAVLDSLFCSVLLSCGLTLMVFVVQLRSLPAGLLAMLPNVLPITVVFGVASLCGMKFDIGTMLTAPIALGLAVHGTLHVLEWFQKRMQAGLSREAAVVSAVTHCGPAIWQTGWVVGLGLLALVPAELPLISRFGGLMAAMTGLTLLAHLVLLPQMLASPLGWFFVPPQPKTDATDAASKPPQLAQIDAAA